MSDGSDQDSKRRDDRAIRPPRIELRIIELLAIFPRKAAQLVLLAIIVILVERFSHSLVSTSEPDWLNWAFRSLVLFLFLMSAISIFFERRG
jgi:ABC-type polysaccharide/polyol phosphate export permease